MVTAYHSSRTIFRITRALLALSVAFTALKAEIVSYTISGKTTSNIVTSQAVLAEFPVGTPWSAVVSWDTASSSLFVSDTQSQYRLIEFTLTFEGATGDWTTSALADKASVGLGYEGAADSMQFTSGWGPEGHTNSTLLDLQPYSANITLNDPTGSALPGLSPAPTSLDLSDWSTSAADTGFKLYLNDAGSQVIYGNIESIAVTGASGPGHSDPNAVSAGGSATLTTTATGTIQWQHNGANVTGATAATLALADVQPASAGIYTANITNGTTVTQEFKIVGLSSTSKVIGTGEEVDANIVHANGNIFDQVLLTGAAEAITADYADGQITRTSYIDLDDDIVQVEFSGPGTLSLVLDASSGPALPVNYNQAIEYVKGHAGIVITGATEQTNVSVFSVGKATAVNQTLFKEGTTYDGIADIAFIAISSIDGKFGGVRTANANYFATKGVTGLYAPGVAFQGPVFVGDITAFADATPVLVIGSTTDARITGGSLAQDNAKAVQVSGIDELTFTAGSDSHGNTLDAQLNAAVLEEDGVDVTGEIVVNPSAATAGVELR